MSELKPVTLNGFRLLAGRVRHANCEGRGDAEAAELARQAQIVANELERCRYVLDAIAKEAGDSKGHVCRAGREDWVQGVLGKVEQMAVQRAVDPATIPTALTGVDR